MSILVTGSTGLVGSNLCRKLVSDGQQVIGLTHTRKNQIIDFLLGHKNFKIFTNDIRDKEIGNIIKQNNIKTVFHLVAQMPYSPKNSLMEVNMQGTLNMLEVSLVNGVENFIFASSMSVYSEPPQYLPVDENHPTQPLTVYGKTKMASEEYCGNYSKDMMIVILRYSGIYGNGMTEKRAVSEFIQCALSNQPIEIFGDGKQSSDYVYVDDIVQGTVLAWEKKKSGIFNIGSGQEAKTTELADKIIKIIGSKSKSILAGVKVDRPFRFVLDISKAKKYLGYSPHSLEYGLTSYIKEVYAKK